MRVIINRLHLADAMNAAAMVVRQRTPKPILACALLTADTTTLNIAATDLEMYYRHKIGTVQVERAGTVAVSAEGLGNIVGACDCDNLTIDNEGDTCHVYADTSHFKLPTLLAKDFPQPEMAEFKASFVLPAKTVRTMVERTAFTIDTLRNNGAKSNFMPGLLFQGDGNRVEVFGSDGHVMATTGAAANGDTFASMVSSRTLGILSRLAVEDGDPIEFQFSENQVVIRGGDASLTASLMDGRCPPFKDYIPKDLTHKASADTETFLSALNRALLATSESRSGIRMAFAKSGLTISARSPENGEATVKYPCKFEGADIQIGMNGKWLLQSVRSLGSESFTMEMTEPNHPALLRGGPDALCVIMPVNLA